MRRFALHTLLAAVTVFAGGPAAAWRIYPPDDRPDELIVELDWAVAETVPLKSLPGPFDRALRDAAVAQKLSYRWRYDKDAEGRAALVVDAAGRAAIRFDFAAREPLDGLRYGAAVVLMGSDSQPLHTFYARADTMAPEAHSRYLQRSVTLDLARAPAWWRDVSAIAFFRMSYHPSQKLDDREVWDAMRRAVWHLTKGRGSEQRG
ncbi:hypothetical protein [Arvimicrobium flavum]|uniref:hypothetical protein n=1 Tax=Arvimicrobium flavum TaxID=3393320 RepID=UPI00237BF068|nr:hypothetical protein [Mesorhizobium shangrilense]